MKVTKMRDERDWWKNANYGAFERDALKVTLLAGYLITMQATHLLIAIRSFLSPVYSAIRSPLSPMSC